MVERSVPQQSAAEPILESIEAASRATWRDFVQVTKPGINKSNLFATFAGYLLAARFALFDWSTLVFTLLGTALVIAGGCAINNYYDRDIDPLMERTKSRPVPDGRLKPKTVLWYGTLLTVLGTLALAFGVNLLSAALALVGFGVYVFIYTMWLKRTSTWNTVIGGVCGSVPPMLGWVAVTNSLDLNAWALFLILFMWQPPHFYALAILKEDDYRRAGIPMLPVVKGLKETKKQTLIFTLLLIPSSVLLFMTGAGSWFYLICSLVLGGVYVALAIKGFYTDDQVKWSKQMFFYSLIYLTTILLVMMLDVVITEGIAMLTR